MAAFVKDGNAREAIGVSIIMVYSSGVVREGRGMTERVKKGEGVQ